MLGQTPQQGGNANFLDRGTMIALIAIGLTWAGWSYYMERTYPQPTAPAAAPVSAPNTTEATAPGSATAQTATTENSNSKTEAPAPIVAEKFPLDTGTLKGEITSAGLGLLQLTVAQYKTRQDEPIVLGAGQEALFGTWLVGEKTPIAFSFTERQAELIQGRASFAGYEVFKRIAIKKHSHASSGVESVAFEIETEARGDLSQFPGFRMSIGDKVQPPAASSIFAPSYDYYDWYVRHEGKDSRSIIDTTHPESLAKMYETLNTKSVTAAAISSHYFTAALADRSPVLPSFALVPLQAQDQALGFLEYKPINRDQSFVVKNVAYIGPKNTKTLAAADAELKRVIDFGFFGMFADPLLWLLRFFHGIFNNWGIAIIGMTLVVRVLVLPFNYYSYKSMKVMQEIQPQMTSLREKYKDNPQRMNEEVMKLMKDKGANPLGGCLPMLLQLPVFFALYQVLAQSIELYRAPFMLWITDLSSKDPFYVLPVLMAIAMFFQQKLTPISDPQQAKILKWMPLIFAIFMIALPSGLALYILISTLFGIAQQKAFMRDPKAAQAMKAAQA